MTDVVWLHAFRILPSRLMRQKMFMLRGGYIVADKNKIINLNKMLKETGCDGVMIGRAAVSNPWIFRQILQLQNGLSAPKPDYSERKTLIMDHYNYLTDSMGEFKAALPMRGLLLRYTKGLPHSTRFREKITRIKDLETLSATVEEYFNILEGREA